MARKELESKAGKYADIETWNKKGSIKEGDTLEGYLYDRDSFQTKYGTMYIYVIEKLDGSLIKLVGQKNIVSKHLVMNICSLFQFHLNHLRMYHKYQLLGQHQIYIYK